MLNSYRFRSANVAEQDIINSLSQVEAFCRSSDRDTLPDRGGFGANTRSDLRGVVSQQSFLTSHNSMDPADTTTEPMTQALVSSEAHTEDAASLSSTSLGMARGILPRTGDAGHADDVRDADDVREIMSNASSGMASGIPPPEDAAGDAGHSDQEVAESDDARTGNLRFPSSNLTLSGIPQSILREYEVDRSRGGGKLLMRYDWMLHNSLR